MLNYLCPFLFVCVSMYYKIILFNIIQIIGQARKALIYSNLTTNVY